MTLSFPGDCVRAQDCTSEEQQWRLHTAGEMDFLKQFSQVTKQTATNNKEVPERRGPKPEFIQYIMSSFQQKTMRHEKK